MNNKVFNAAESLAYCDGQFARLEDINFKINTQALNYGTGVFEGIRAYWNQDTEDLNLFRVEEHFTRLIESAHALKIELSEQVQDFIGSSIELIRLNELKQNIYLRPLVLKKSLLPGERFGVKLSGVSSSVCINVLPMGKYVDQNGIRCLISSWQRIPNESVPSHAKITGSYVNSALAFEQAKEQGYDEAIMLNQHGLCTEATTSNVFIVKDRTVLTPPISDGLLNGITRQSIFDMCKYLSLECKEQHLTQSDLLDADECFLTGTGVEILPVLAINQTQLTTSVGNVTRSLSELFENIKYGKEPEFSHWLTPVY